MGLLPESQVHLVDCWGEEKPVKSDGSVLLWPLILVATLDRRSQIGHICLQMTLFHRAPVLGLHKTWGINHPYQEGGLSWTVPVGSALGDNSSVSSVSHTGPTS